MAISPPIDRASALPEAEPRRGFWVQAGEFCRAQPLGAVGAGIMKRMMPGTVDLLVVSAHGIVEYCCIDEPAQVVSRLVEVRGKPLNER